MTAKSAINNDASKAEASTHQPNQEVFLIPTFGVPKKAEGAFTSSSRIADPFLYFSNQERRMAYLTHRTKETQEKSATSKRCVVAEERKTRISFEVHPSVIMEDLFLVLNGMDYDDDEDIIWRALFGMEEEHHVFVTPQ